MKKILFITPFTPDNQGVGVSYTSQLLRELAKTCFIDLVYFKYPSEEPYLPVHRNIRVLKFFNVTKRQKIKGILLAPLTFPLFTSRKNIIVERFLKKQAEDIEYDIIYFDFSQTFSYAACINHPNKILMAHDVIAQKYSRMKTYLKPWAVRTERKMLKLGKAVFTFSEKDCQLIKELYNVDGYSTTFFLNSNVIEAQPTTESNYFVFFGAWSWVENCEALNWFIDKVYGYINKNYSFKVIGGGKMPNYLKNKIDFITNMEYLGFVQNPYNIIANAKAEIAPLHMGAGVKVKCVEALGCGTPVIGTEVAFEGVGEKYRDAMFLADRPEEFASIINEFDYSLEKKQKLKEFFIESYNNKQIFSYINGKM